MTKTINDINYTLHHNAFVDDNHNVIKTVSDLYGDIIHIRNEQVNIRATLYAPDNRLDEFVAHIDAYSQDDVLVNTVVLILSRYELNYLLNDGFIPI